MSNTRRPEGARHVPRLSYPRRTHRHRTICSHGRICRKIATYRNPKPYKPLPGATPGQPQIRPLCLGCLMAGPEKDERRRAHRCRRRQGRYRHGRHLFPGCLDISQRPQPVADRTCYGEWRPIWSALREARRRWSVATNAKAGFWCWPRPKARGPPRAMRFLFLACVLCH